MRPVSARFLDTLRGSHEFVARARVCAPGQSGTSPTGTQIAILGGDVTLDGTADIRGTLSLDTDGNGMWPSRSTDLLAPFGNEIFVERGVRYGDGTSEYVSLGYYRIGTPDQDSAPDGPISLSCSDRMAGIIDGRVTAPRQYPAGTIVGTLVSTLVNEIYPYATVEWDDTTYLAATGRALVLEEDRYAFLNDLITSYGKVWFWDYRGVLTIKTAPDSSVPLYVVDAGLNGVLVQASRTLTRDGLYNAVVATGDGMDTTAPVRGTAYDANPGSPTYWFGGFGQVPRFYSSPFITTDAQALNAARELLRRGLGLPYSVSFQSIPNPALEPDDPVQVVYGPSVAPETHVIEQITIPLTAADVMTAATREQTLVTYGVGGI